MTADTIVFDTILAATEISSMPDGSDPQESMVWFAKNEARQSVDSYRTAESAFTDAAPGWRYNWSTVGTMLDNEQRLKFWYEVCKASETDDGEPDFNLSGLKVALMNRVRPFMSNSGGRSTSQVSNAIDAAEREFTARLLSRFGELIGLDRNFTY